MCADVCLILLLLILLLLLLFQLSKERVVLYYSLCVFLSDVGTDSSRAEDPIASPVRWTSAGTAPSAKKWLICSTSTSTGEGRGGSDLEPNKKWMVSG